MGANIGRNLAKPQKSVYGWIATALMKKHNTYLELNAVRLCQIQPDYKVLEVGFGIGKGLESAYRCVKDGSGVVYGIDISEKMRETAEENLKKQIAEGKVIIHPYSVDNMQFDDNTFDCVFHCNSYYFWPDLNKAAKELNRVMKPGATIITTMNFERIRKLYQRGIFTEIVEPDRYMDALKANNFTDVTETYHIDTNASDEYSCISAKSASSNVK